MSRYAASDRDRTPAHAAGRKRGQRPSSPCSSLPRNGHRLYPALHLTATTGMRRGEIAGLRWGDWNAGLHQLSISRSR